MGFFNYFYLMEILIPNVKDLLNESLTMEDRGVMLTILLLKDPLGPKITLGKLRSTISLSKISGSLIKLQDLGFIKWSGYSTAVKKSEDKKYDTKIEEIINFINDLYGRKFDHKSESTIVNLRNRLIDSGEEAVRKVITNRYEVWKDDKVMGQYLTPHTIFRPSRFDKYLEEANRTGRGEGILKALKIGLKEGDVLTYELVKDLPDDEIFNIDVEDFDNRGNKIGYPIEKTITGKYLKLFLKSETNKRKRDGTKQNEYTYKSRG